MSFGELQGFRDNKGFGSSVLKISTGEPALYSTNITVKKNGITIATGQFDTSGKAEIITRESGELVISAVSSEGETAKTAISVTYYGTYNIELSTVELYEFRIAKNVSDPEDRVEYINDTIGMIPAYMDYSAGTFNYGSWKNAFFMNVKPCMLKADGTVDYYLDPDDYSKKENGEPSDIANSAYNGNTMVQFPKVWLYCTEDVNYEYYHIANKKITSGYNCYAHHDMNGKEIDYIYMPAYNGTLISEKLRSLSGFAPMNSQTAANEITYATANGTGWYTEVFADRMLVNILLTLIGKTTDGQTTFGNGHYTGGSSASSLLNTGTMNTRGLFYGTNGTGAGVKVFGIENWWGNQWRRLAGWINASGQQKVKLTYGKEDGSSVVGYNTTGNGYIPLSATPGGASGGYINKCTAGAWGRVPYTASGSSTTYDTDGLWYNNSQTDYAYAGGVCNNGLLCGPWAVNLGDAASNAGWHIGASVSCKPSVAA